MTAATREFFKFDIKDTLRLLVWITISVFTLGGVYANNVAMGEKVIRAQATADLAREGQSKLLATLQSVEVEMRYVNAKIDELRTDLRARRE